MTQRKLKVNCPQCNEIVPWTDASPYRPFCCERCKLIDLGDWASEKHSIPGERVKSSEEDGHDNYDY
jgi:endogenous inhibitor of DNA gyrase (YacG/DUF329 family)